MLTCLICNRDMQQDTTEVADLLREHGCISTTMGPDGREFVFSNGERGYNRERERRRVPWLGQRRDWTQR